MILPKASELNTPPHTHTPTTHKEQANHLNFHYRTSLGWHIDHLTEDVPDQSKALLDARHEYTAWFNEMQCLITAFLLANKIAVVIYIYITV